MLELAASADRPYELVVLDSDMPGMSGAEVVQAIRAAPALRPSRIVMLTSAASGRPPDVERFLTKPVRRAALLEALAEALADMESSAPSAAVAAPAELPLRGHVLVAEDNPVNQLVIESMLRRRGLFVDLVADGLEAVERLDAERHDAIFMDCQMPNLDGYEATARIRAAEPADRHIPIVAMTAHAFAGDRERCLQAGMDDYLSKPLRSEDLDPVLERWLAGPAVSAPEGAGFVDDERFGSLRGLGPELVERLVGVFARTTPPLLEELRAAVERDDDEACAKLGHKLRGSSETVGARRLSELARRIETGDRAHEAAAELRGAYSATLDELQRLGVAAP